MLFGALIEPGPLGAAVAGRAALLAALVFRARLVLLLALAAVERPRQHRPGRTKPLKLDFQRLDPVPRRLRALAQAGVLPGQRLDRSLLAPRSPQRRAQLSSLVGRQLRQRRPGRPKLGEPGLQLLLPGLEHLQGMAQPEDLVGQRPGPGLGVAQYPHLPVEPKGLAGQLLRGLPDALRPLLLLVEARVQPGVLLVPPDHLLVEPAEFRAKRPDGLLLVRGRLQDGAPPGRSGPRPGRALTGLRCRQGLAQPGVLLAQRPGRIEGRRDAGFRKERLQARHFRRQGLCCKPDVGVSQFRTTTVLSSCFCVGQTVL